MTSHRGIPVMRSANASLRKSYSKSQLMIYFKSSHFIPYERNELYGHLDFLANVGGLLGLFIGISLLSFFEIIYFLSLRIICNLRLYKNWYGKENK
ncbi:hypothetical protein NQ315_005857 [Exocentrus adspersus]|uniref:Uncharacterized protein n=1 Tax=Exocentrus adspersus TaxID=1586481 RepID=A0AAV8VSI2_9CUCU|nr:hypothetical protein NQ315_005857 [Exocentrus adspersus]